MATTAKGTPYVESSDLVADYPTVSLALAEHIDDFGGKVLQVVRATDTTQRTTTSASFVDVTGMSVTITPQRSTSAVIIVAKYLADGGHNSGNDSQMDLTITDSSNNSVSGAEQDRIGIFGQPPPAATQAQLQVTTLSWAYATPATTSAVTYKLRFRLSSGNLARIRNEISTGQMFAIEVSA